MLSTSSARFTQALDNLCQASQGLGAGDAGVYVDEGPDRDALTAALSREHYVPVYLDPKTARSRRRSRGHGAAAEAMPP